MLSMLASYRDFPEDSATRMLSNDVLIEKLQGASDDKAFQELVESEIVNENDALVEEKAIIAAHLEKERKEREKAQKALEAETQKRKQKEQEIVIIQARAEERVKDAEKAKSESDVEKEKAQLIARKAEEKADLVIAIGKSILVGILLVAGFEVILFGLNISWLVDHQNSIGIQASIDAILLLLPFAIFVRKSRNWVLGIMATILIGTFALLGGTK